MIIQSKKESNLDEGGRNRIIVQRTQVITMNNICINNDQKNCRSNGDIRQYTLAVFWFDSGREFK